jgi:hypothetical protein
MTSLQKLGIQIKDCIVGVQNSHLFFFPEVPKYGLVHPILYLPSSYLSSDMHIFLHSNSYRYSYNLLRLH